MRPNESSVRGWRPGAGWRGQVAGLLVGLLVLLLALLGGPPPAAAVATDPTTRARFFRLLAAGDSVYARRQSYQSIGNSLAYFNRAYALALASRDTLLLAEAVFAKGRVYDAWNKQPYRTTAYLLQAVALFAHLPAARERYYYARYLLVHAYDKVPDTLAAVRAARTLYRELRRRPEWLPRVPTTVELAWSCTEVGAYALADSVLRHLTRRARIVNDPRSYDHLTHYYLVRARLDLDYRHQATTPYLDSLATACTRLTNLFDREYYSRQLAALYAAAHQYQRAYGYLAAHRRYADSLGGRAEAAQMQRALQRSEERAQAARQQEEAATRRARAWTVGSLSAGLLLLAGLSVYFYRQNRRTRAQAGALARANHALDEKVTQVELLNKEIQHRVKNNLHMVFSLLQMQERRTTSEEVAAHLLAARLRVESIAALHNQLLRTPTSLDLGAYLRSLITNVVTCLANDKQVVTHLQTDVLHLPERAYLPLSLILNEWVTNSIKYAEPPGGGLLEISVEVRHQPTQVSIHYHDTGRAPAAAGAPGLGTQLIGLLTRQLGATLSSAPHQPYTYELRLPHPA